MFQDKRIEVKDKLYKVSYIVIVRLSEVEAFFSYYFSTLLEMTQRLKNNSKIFIKIGIIIAVFQLNKNLKLCTI
ncbi:hypothetical protein RCZ01_01770 [Capnocytophaga felis]|uniref:Uncharacterized protein n=1 Tax=Capnocytophaga felis TaxID=2267611 RepID=A0A5M4B6I4_9FLAO|nr:hypothetical protein RCZ01_01770 [Capnocytophaga felis]GET49327.1 hypothetical protein RCZ02_21580 [Capnocytophaga felis]